MSANYWIYTPITSISLLSFANSASIPYNKIVLCSSEVKVVQWTSDFFQLFISNMGINFCGLLELWSNNS